MPRRRNTTTEPDRPSAVDGSASVETEDLHEQWQRVVGRRSFLKGVGAAGAVAIPGSALFASEAMAATPITKGDAAILRFLAAAELIEADLWEQYAELGGVNGGNPAYQAALSNIDSDAPTYIALNTEDEKSHAAFLNAFLKAKGVAPVNLDAFRTLPSSKAKGARKIGRLTSLMSLDVDTSWYTRYRSSKSPDFGATFPQAITIRKQPAIPISNTDTPPNGKAPLPPKTRAQKRMQVIACTAVFHFAFIEQGGMSLYATLSDKVTSAEVLRVLASISGTENQHFATWQDDAGNAAATPVAPVTDPETHLTIPDLNKRADKALFATNRIFPHPTEFIDKRLPLCSVVRPTDPRLGGARPFMEAAIADRLFVGQSQAFFSTLRKLAAQADAAQRHAG
jgi:Ferritin-like domain